MQLPAFVEHGLDGCLRDGLASLRMFNHIATRKLKSVSLGRDVLTSLRDAAARIVAI
jgi:hypothetical protein